MSAALIALQMSKRWPEAPTKHHGMPPLSLMEGQDDVVGAGQNAQLLQRLRVDPWHVTERDRYGLCS